MKRMKIYPLLLGSLLVLLTACGEKHDGPIFDFEAEQESHLYSDTLDIYLYGATRVTRYPVAVGDRLKVAFRRDTVDLFLIRDRENGRIVLPVIPDSVDVRIRMGKELHTEGLPQDHLLEKWYTLNHRDSVTPELDRFLMSQETGNLGALLALASYERFGSCDESLEGTTREALFRASEMMTVLGLSAEYFSPRSFFVYRSGKGDRPVSLQKVMGKDTAMVVSIFAPSSASAGDTAFIRSLDTLSRQRYFILPGTDSLPASWRKLLGVAPKKNHTAVDSSGLASRLVGEMGLARLPEYMVVDSLARIRYRTGDRDSLILYLKEKRKE